MAFGRYVEGLALIALAFVPIGAASYAWRERLLTGWTGAAARLAEFSIGLATVLCVSEALGAVHLFRLAAMATAMAIVGFAGLSLARQSSHRSITTTDSQLVGRTVSKPSPPGAKVVAIVAVSTVMADWATRIVDAYNHGMTSADTLWYHMPFAARFVQQGTIVPIHYFDDGSATAFFPANSELLHALGIMFMGNDVLSPLINLGWLAIALLAAWCVGSPFGVAPVTLTGVAMLLATPGLVATQPGGAYDDIVGLALLLSCAALLLTAAAHGGPTRVFGQAVAALAAGIALGTKFTFIAPVGAFTVGVWALARRGKRLSEGGVWIILVVVTGGFWYVRNFFAVGNPLPSLALKLGPLALPSPAVTIPSSTFADFLTSAKWWHRYFLPGLRLSFGPAWWALLTLAAAGLILGALNGSGRMSKMIACVGIVTAAAFVVTPQYLAILGVPVGFVYNVRYVDPALALGLVMLPLSAMLRQRGRAWWLLGGYAAILAVTQFDGTLWPTDLLAQRFAPPIGGIDSLIGLLLGAVVLGTGLILFVRGRRWVKVPSTFAKIGITIVVVIAGFGLQQFYLRNRYVQVNPVLNFTEREHISDSRIAVIGTLAQLQYELYGQSLSNYVQYLGRTAPHDGYLPITSCSLWRQTLNSGHYQYVVISTGFVRERKLVFTTPFSYLVWTRTDPASTLVRRVVGYVSNNGGATQYLGLSLFRLNGPLNPGGCSAPALRHVVSTPG